MIENQMIEKSYEDIKFAERENAVRAIFLNNYYFDISNEELLLFGKWEVTENKSLFIDKKALKKFESVLSSGFERLVNRINNRQTVYIHSNSGIPLIGTNYFGIIDRNTNLLEVRPNTGCNLNCIYCSVNEGKKGTVDYVVEKDYLVRELARLIKDKECDDIEIHIGPQGEPLLYSPLASLIRDIRKIKEVKRVSIDTNGILLNKNKVDELVDAGITQFNISINALNQETAKKMAGCNYSIKPILETIEYIASKKAMQKDLAKNDSGKTGKQDYESLRPIRLVLAPVYVPGINENELEKLIGFAKKTGSELGIQNFLSYKRGRNPVKGISMDEFYAILEKLEKMHDIKLILSETDFNIKKTKPLKPVFKKDEIVSLVVTAPGKQKYETLAVAKERVIQVRDCFDCFESLKGKRIKAKITRTKHNIYYAVKV